MNRSSGLGQDDATEGTNGDGANLELGPIPHHWPNSIHRSHDTESQAENGG